MKHLALITLLFLLVGNLNSQITGGLGSSMKAPSIPERSKLNAGVVSSDVNLFTGELNTGISLGKVSTPGGLFYDLSLNYSSSYSSGSTQPILAGIPYGEGWNVNLPTISVESEIFLLYQTIKYEAENDPNKIGANQYINYQIEENNRKYQNEGDVYWFAPYLSIPGVCSGRAVFRYIDENDGQSMVFTLNGFEQPVELRFSGNLWEVRISDGNIYTFRTCKHNVVSATNRRNLSYNSKTLIGNKKILDYIFDNNSERSLNYSDVKQSITPKTDFSMWYCDEIYSRNLPQQSISFRYEKFGKFNYFQEFNQPDFLSALGQLEFTLSAGYDFEVYNDLILKEVTAFSSVGEISNKIQLNYKTDLNVLNKSNLGAAGRLIDFRIPGSNTVRVDSMYTQKKLYGMGLSTPNSTSNGWFAYKHVAQASKELNNFTNTSDNIGAFDPYLYGGNQNYRTPINEVTPAFNNSYLESDRIGEPGSRELIPGDVYRVDALVVSGNGSPNTTMGTLDLNIVSGYCDGNLQNPARPYSTFDSRSSQGLVSSSIGSKNISLFSTSNRALKWTVGKSHKVVISNSFVMPNYRSDLQGFQIQIGPGNADINYRATNLDFLGLTRKNPTDFPNDARLSMACNYIDFPLKSAANLRTSFGIGMPWSNMTDIFEHMTALPEEGLYNFWWNNVTSPDILTKPSIPTKLGETVKMNDIAVYRVSKNPYVLESVNYYVVNGEYASYSKSGEKGLRLVSQKKFRYESQLHEIVENYEYTIGSKLRYKKFKQVRVLLKEVEEVLNRNLEAVVTPNKVITRFNYTLFGASTNPNPNSPDEFYFPIDYKDLEGNSVFDPTLAAGKHLSAYLLTEIINPLGGIKQIEYDKFSKGNGLTRIVPNSTTSRVICNLADPVATCENDVFSSMTNYHITPRVVAIMENDEKNILQTNNTTKELTRRTSYDYDQRTVISKSSTHGLASDLFFGTYSTLGSVVSGFSRVTTMVSNVSKSDDQFRNQLLVTKYEFYGNEPQPPSPAERDPKITERNYLLFGKLKKQTTFTQGTTIATETEHLYDITLAFENARARKLPLRSRIQSDEKFYNTYISGYEYEDYYNKKPLKFFYNTYEYIYEIVPRFDPETGTIKLVKVIKDVIKEQIDLVTGEDAYDAVHADMLNGSSATNTAENPRFLEYYNYKDLLAYGDKFKIPAKVMLSSYFIKKVKEINRTYDPFLSKARTGSTSNVPTTPPVAVPNDPFGGGIINPKPNNVLRDAPLILNTTLSNTTKATTDLVNASPLSDNVLKNVITSVLLSSEQKTQVLLAQSGLSNEVLSMALHPINAIHVVNMQEVVAAQSYLSDAVISSVLNNITTTTNLGIVQTVLLKNSYLSTSIVNQMIAKTSDLSISIQTNVLLQQPTLANSSVEALAAHKDWTVGALEAVLNNRYLGNESVNSLISKTDITGSTISSIVQNALNNIDAPVVENIFKTPIAFVWNDVERILNNAGSLTPETKTLLESRYVGVNLNLFVESRMNLDNSCINPTQTSFDYIENITEYEYYEADYTGKALGTGYHELLQFPTQGSVTTHLIDQSGTPQSYSETKNDLYLRHQPSWQVYKTKSYSSHQPDAYAIKKYYYLFDLKNKNDRHWYYYDLKNGAKIKLVDVDDFVDGNYDLDTVVDLSDIWGTPAGSLGTGYRPKYDGEMYSIQYNLMNVPYQETSITKATADLIPVEKSIYHFYDSDWNFDDLNFTAQSEVDMDIDCQDEEEENETEVDCNVAVLDKYRIFGYYDGLYTEPSIYYYPLMEGECIYRTITQKFFHCPSTFNALACPQVTSLVRCNVRTSPGEDDGGDEGESLTGDESTEAQELIQLQELLTRRLHKRSSIVQIATDVKPYNTTAQNKSLSTKPTTIADFYIYKKDQFTVTANMIFPYDTLEVEHVVERNTDFQPTLVRNSNGLYTKYYFNQSRTKKHYIFPNCTKNNYTTLTSYSVGLPTRITTGYYQADSMWTEYFYDDFNNIRKTVNQNGHSMEYQYDGFQRLIVVTENGDRVLSRTAYHNFENIPSNQYAPYKNAPFLATTKENYVTQANYLNATDFSRSRTFIDALGRDYMTVTNFSDVNGEILQQYSGATTYDKIDRILGKGRPYATRNGIEFDFTQSSPSTAQQASDYQADFRGRMFQSTDFGIARTDVAHSKRMEYSIVNSTFAHCELGLSSQEDGYLFGVDWSENARFYRTISYDQNSNKMIAYTNPMGQQVATISYPSDNAPVVTLFVYNSHGAIGKVINPKKQVTDYEYNLLGLPVVEKTTDAGNKYMIYDKLGKVAATFDQNDQTALSSSNLLKGRIFQYDTYGRPKGQYRFEIGNSIDRNPFGFMYKSSYVNTGPIGRTSVQPTSNSTYLRSFSWTNATYANLLVELGKLPIPEKTWNYSNDMLDPLNFNKLIQSNAYDELGNLIQVQEYRHDAQERVSKHTTTMITPSYPNGVSVTMEYEYNYAGSLLAEHVDTYADQTQDLHYYYGYDNANRLRNVSVAKGSGTPSKVVEYGYFDETNLLKSTRYLSKLTGGSNPLTEIQNIQMNYDIRDRLKTITSELMNYRLSYDNEQLVASGGLAVLQSNNWNGNINGVYRSFVLSGTVKGFPIQAGVSGPTAELNYGYQYDKMNRLRAADAAGFTRGTLNLGGVLATVGDEYSTFDVIGNFTNVTRMELGFGGAVVMPKNLTYTYVGGNNRLANVLSTGGNQSFTYDGNGNLLTHSAKQITATTYTRASYPARLAVGNNNVSYYYDGTDQRIFKRTTVGGVKEELYFKDVAGRDMVILTKNGTAAATLEYQVHGANRVATVDLSKGTAVSTVLTENELTFFLYDHLGNNRMAFGLRKTPTRTEYQIMYAADYFPYGRVLRSYTNGSTTADRYPTTGHERDDETGLDYRGARFYDGEIGRFLSVDPKAVKFPAWSTYNYVLGNPIMLIDPDGKAPTDWFLNIKTGNVVYVKGASEVNQGIINKMGWETSPSDYERLGGDNMFGNTVQWGTSGDILQKEAFSFYNYSEFFMETEGYVKGDRLSVLEAKRTAFQYISGENVETSSFEFSSTKKSMCYVKPTDLYNRENEKQQVQNAFGQTTLTLRYDTNVKYGESGEKQAFLPTMDFPEEAKRGFELSVEAINFIKYIFK